MGGGGAGGVCVSSSPAVAARTENDVRKPIEAAGGRILLTLGSGTQPAQFVVVHGAVFVHDAELVEENREWGMK